MNRFWNRCARHRESICLLASGALAEKETAEAQSHLAACADCRRYFDEIRNVAAPLTKWEDHFEHVKPGPETSQRWASAIKAATPAGRRPPPRAFFLNLWFELIWPARRIWAGFAAVWLVIAAIHLAEPGRPTIANNASPPDSAGTLLAWRVQGQIIAEFSEPAPPAVPEKPRPGEPKPRSERQAACCVG